MPRKSLRQQSFDGVFEEFDILVEYLSSEDEGGLEEALEIVVDKCVDIYLEPIPSVPKGTDCLIHLLARYDDHRFKQELRVSRQKFNEILILIKDHPVFHTEKEMQQFPVHVQLAATLYRLGHYGSSTSIYKLARQFGMGDGSSVNRVTDRVIKAILSLADKFILWPNPEERRQIRNEVRDKIPNCIGFIDGTHVPLEEKPLSDPESYFNRNKEYSIQMQCIVGHDKKIFNAFIKYPGSVHDARVFAESDFGRSVENYLSPGEWIAGDSAYKNTSTVIVPFRSNATFGSVRGRRRFNKKLSSHRVKVEHVFGMLKEIFTSLRGLRIRVDKNVGHRKACNWISACCILYNLVRDDISEDEWMSLENNITLSDANDYSILPDENNEERAKLYNYFGCF